MKKYGLALSALALLMVGCSTSTLPPVVPVTAQPTAMLAEPNDEVESVASSDVSLAALGRLEQLGLTQQATAPGSAVRQDGTLLVGGQPLFLMGFYHVSWAGTVDTRLRDMKKLAQMGFNTMSVSMLDPEADLVAFRQLLDESQARGMNIMAEDFNATSIRTLKTHPAMLGWMIADDCNSRITPEELQKRHDTVKAQDPGHITYTSMAISFANSHSDYFGSANAVGNQAYPIDGGDAINVVYPVMKTLVAQAKAKGTLPIANLQAFRWQNGRYPTPRELNNMTNQALAAGVKGILYYTYLDRTNNLATYTALNGELGRLASEVKALAPVLMNGERAALNVSATDNQAAANIWTYGGRKYLQVVSLSDNKTQRVSIQLPGAGAALVPLFAGRPTGMKVSGSTVSGSLGTLASHWYEVQ